ALCLPPALRFNEPVVSDAMAALATALGVDDAPTGVEELARLGEFGRLRDFAIPEDELGAVALVAVQRPGARANPRPAAAEDVELLLRSIWGAVDARVDQRDDARVIVEYAGIVAAVSLLAATLTGAYGNDVAAVFASGTAGAAAAGRAARAQGLAAG